MSLHVTHFLILTLSFVFCGRETHLSKEIPSTNSVVKTRLVVNSGITRGTPNPGLSASSSLQRVKNSIIFNPIVTT